MGTKVLPVSAREKRMAAIPSTSMVVGLLLSVAIGYGYRSFWIMAVLGGAFTVALYISIDPNRLMRVVRFLTHKRRKGRASDPLTRLSEFSSSQLNPDELQAESQVAQDVQAARNRLKTGYAETQEAALDSGIDVDITAKK